MRETAGQVLDNERHCGWEKWNVIERQNSCCSVFTCHEVLYYTLTSKTTWRLTVTLTSRGDFVCHLCACCSRWRGTHRMLNVFVCVFLLVWQEIDFESEVIRG